MWLWHSVIDYLVCIKDSCDRSHSGMGSLASMYALGPRHTFLASIVIIYCLKRDLDQIYSTIHFGPAAS